MSQHHLGLHKIQLVFHFCLYMPCDTKCRTFFRMAPRNILKERTAYLASYNFFTNDVNQYKNTPLSQLYQPPRSPLSRNTYQQLLSSCEYCKDFKNSFFIGYHQKQSFSDVLQNKCS